MSLDIPYNIEREIEQFAQQQRITADEAVIRLIERGLCLGIQSQRISPVHGIGLFGSSEDAAIIDEVVAIAYEERRRPSNLRLTSRAQVHSGYGHSFRMSEGARSNCC